MTQPVQKIIKKIKRYFDLSVTIAIISLIVVFTLSLVGLAKFPLFILLIGFFLLVIILCDLFFIRKKLLKQLDTGFTEYVRLQEWADTSKKQNDIAPIENTIGCDEIDPTIDPIIDTIQQLQQKLKEAQTNDGKVDKLLRERALLDVETGVGNREFFTNRLDAILLANHDNEEIRGAVILIQCNEGELIESLYGHKVALTLMSSLIETIKIRLQQSSYYFIARRSEFELALLLPGFYVKETEKLADRLLKKFTAASFACRY